MTNETRPAGPVERQGRGALFRSRLRGLAISVWFLVSLLIYGLGLGFLYVGKGLIAISGWSRREGLPAPSDAESTARRNAPPSPPPR